MESSQLLEIYLGRKYENNGEKIPEKTLLSNLCAEFWVCWKEKERLFEK